MSERDPRVDPKVGEQLKVPQVDYRTVVGVDNGRIKWKSPWNESTCSLTTWRKWARNAEVIHAAE